MSLLKRTGTAIDDVTWDATELATKVALDDVKKTADSAKSTADSAKTTADGALQKSGGTMTGAINMNDKQIKNVAAPTDVNDAVNKKYLDDAIGGVQPAGDYVSKSGDTMTGNLNMGNNQITNVNTMTVGNVIVKGAAESQISVKTTGDASRSELDLNDASDNPVVIKGIDTPSDDTDAANKSYVDAVDAKVIVANAEITGLKNTVNGIVNGTTEIPYLPIKGGTMQGALHVLEPMNSNDAVPKSYVDSWHKLKTESASFAITPAHWNDDFKMYSSTIHVNNISLKKGYGILVINVSKQTFDNDLIFGMNFFIGDVLFFGQAQFSVSYSGLENKFIIPYIAFRDVAVGESIQCDYYMMTIGDDTGATNQINFNIEYSLHLANID